MSALEHYVMACAVAIPWQRFVVRAQQVVHLHSGEVAVSERPLPLGALGEALDECLASIETQCFLAPALVAVHRILRRAFSCVVQFHAQCAAIISSTLGLDAGTGEERELQQEQSACLDKALAFALDTQQVLARHVAVLCELLGGLASNRGRRYDHPCLEYLLHSLRPS